jgi:two-component system sensor histidine kinase YcbA
VIVGAIRTISTLVAYYIVKHHYNGIKKNEREKYYREIIVFISKLKTELFILNKSRNDIEKTVAYAHHCYDSIENDEIKVPMLKIAKDIHEIKKDYLRVIASMNSIFTMDTNIRYMSIKDILSIVKDSVLDLIQLSNKKIEVFTEYNELFITDKFYSIISILGNLVINSIDAIDSYGEIRISVNLGENIVFTVKDSGEGIKKGKEEIIFKFGYTTKYDKETGKMSTGLGLSHVKSIVTENFNGSVRVESSSNKGTKFIIEIPKGEVLRKDDSDEINLYSG